MSQEDNTTETIDGHLNETAPPTAHKTIPNSSGWPVLTVSITVAAVSLTLIIVIGLAAYFIKRLVKGTIQYFQRSLYMNTTAAAHCSLRQALLVSWIGWVVGREPGR